MSNAHHLFSILAQAAGAASLSLGRDGQTSIPIGRELTIHVTQADDRALELSFRIPQLDRPDRAVMLEMLEANAAAAAGETGSLGLDGTEALYRERWLASETVQHSVKPRFDALLALSRRWRGGDAAALLERARLRREADARPPALSEDPPLDEDADIEAAEPVMIRI
ncbi:CesT family type III secretion system chaperone [Aquibium sp. ELW1220]|uniref:CesT family type III secretion system chaperone n=1 Tax=Aquibium sp. ELW1220 TaxID=2976766 RepID=UPI0025B1C38C|nr:CesT family type III secretion system chaperone [Aquibium sp. ELW1220]MDN2582506.1 CesT family type III secretion system chaperone [Aquibium sp. ELW1220]